MSKYFIFIILVFVLGACKKEPQNNTDTTDNYQHGVIIGNEGNFTHGNGSISFYNPDKKEVINNVFFNKNNFPLGDVVQSVYLHDGKYFIVVNNSGKIVVADSENFEFINRISGLESPRYILFIDNSRAYVSDLYSKSINVINPSTFKIISNIYIGNTTEQMVPYKNFVYVTSWSFNNKIYKINTYSDQVIDSLEVTKQPNSIVLDKNNKLWVLSDGCFSGSAYGQDTAALTKIDAENFIIEKTYNFENLEVSPSCLTINNQQDSLFFIIGSWTGSVNSGGVYKMSINDNSLPELAFIPAEGRNIYKIGLHSNHNEIYVSDVKDYVHNGDIYRYYTSGTAIDTFEVNIAPGSFCFVPD
ncbi:MAG: hypothetical protein Kow0068_07830 [Marinilabiliales bacterium]